MAITPKDLRSLAHGQRVVWSDGSIGFVHHPKLDKSIRLNKGQAVWIEWEDGQKTHELDDWALENVTLDQSERDPNV